MEKSANRNLVTKTDYERLRHLRIFCTANSVYSTSEMLQTIFKYDNYVRITKKKNNNNKFKNKLNHKS